MKHKILWLLCLGLIVALNLCACGGQSSANMNENEVNVTEDCIDEVKNATLNDAIVQVYDIIFNFDTEDTSKASYVYDKLGQSAYEITPSHAATGLLEAGAGQAVYVYFEETCILQFYVDNKTKETLSCCGQAFL